MGGKKETNYTFPARDSREVLQRGKERGREQVTAAKRKLFSELAKRVEENEYGKGEEADPAQVFT